METRTLLRASGDTAVLSRDEKERAGLVPAPIHIEGHDPLRWADLRLIAEAGRCNNSVEWAVRAAQAAAQAGFWGFKVQLLNRRTITSRTARTYGQGIGEPETQWEAFAGGLVPQEWQTVKQACDDLGLVFFASCWDEAAVDLAVDTLGVRLLKVGSADITHEWLLRYMSHCGLPVILSTGGAWTYEIDDAIGWLSDAPQIALAACTLAYPALPQDAHLNRIGSLARAFPGCLVGYSDHCREPWIVGEAKKAGACFVEAHWTVDPGTGGDHDFALHPGNVDGIWGPADGCNGDHWGDPTLFPSDAEQAAVRQARRSVACNVPVAEGERFRMWDLMLLRPGDGVPPWRLADLVGCRASRDYEAGEQVDVDELR